MAYEVAACLRANLKTLDGKPVVGVTFQGSKVAVTTRDGEEVGFIVRTTFAEDD